MKAHCVTRKQHCMVCIDIIIALVYWRVVASRDIMKTYSRYAPGPRLLDLLQKPPEKNERETLLHKRKAETESTFFGVVVYIHAVSE